MSDTDIIAEANKRRVPDAYAEINRTREQLHEAFEDHDAEEFARVLANYTQAITDGVRAIQAPMWGQNYTMDPRRLCPDGFGDETISLVNRVRHVQNQMRAANGGEAL